MYCREIYLMMCVVFFLLSPVTIFSENHRKSIRAITVQSTCSHNCLILDYKTKVSMNGQLTIKKFFENSCIRFKQGIEAWIYMFINTSHSPMFHIDVHSIDYNIVLRYACFSCLIKQLIPQRNCNLSTPLLSCYPQMKLEYLLILLFKIFS